MNESSLSRQTTLRKKHWITDPKVVPYVFIAPFLIFFLVIYLYPFISTIMMSFQRIDGPDNVEWIGTANYEKLWNRNFKQALATTFRYAFWDVVVLTIVPLIFAVILNSGSVKYPSFFKSVYFIPALTSTIVVGIVFRLAFGSLPTAPANRLLALFGLPPKDWLMFADTGNFVLILLTLWRWMGVNIIYYISGLQAIPTELYEAAKQLRVPYDLVQYVHENGKLPVVNFAAGGVATPADAALMMQLGAEGVFVGSGIFKSGDPAKRAQAIVKAVTNYVVCEEA